MDYLSIKEFENTDMVKTVFTTVGNGLWRMDPINQGGGCTGEVLAAYQDLGNHIGIRPERMIRAYQTHTTEIRCVSGANGGEGVTRAIEIRDFDGMITDEAGLLLCTLEADCVPVYMFDPVKKVVAMVHSGWKGTANKISANAISKMNAAYGCRPSDILVAYGPCICSDCYEVGKDIYDIFEKKFCNTKMFKSAAEVKSTNSADSLLKVSDCIGNFFLNMKEAITQTLIPMGVKYENIFDTGICTFHDERFYSYRGGANNDRMLTGIMLK